MKIFDIADNRLTKISVRPMIKGFAGVAMMTVMMFVMTVWGSGLSYANDAGPDRLHGDKRPAFFTTLNDVPLMEGLTELPDETLIFDKPEGRIVETVAASGRTGPSAADIEAFYAQTLPHLGWRRVAAGQYLRQDEELRLSVEGGEDSPYVVVTVMPRR